MGDSSISLYRCPYKTCLVKFMKIYQLNDHIPRIHQGKQTRCNNCQKKFSSEEFLQIHQKKYCHQQLQYNNTTGMSISF